MECDLTDAASLLLVLRHLPEITTHTSLHATARPFRNHQQHLHNKYLRRVLARHHHLRIQSAVIPLLCHTHRTQHRVVWVAFRTLMLLLSHFRLYGKACMHSTKTNDDDCLLKWRALKRCERTQTHTHPYMEQNTCFGASSLPASR